MSASVRDTSIHTSVVIPSAYDDYPYLRTRLGPSLYNIIPLPRTVEETASIPFGVKFRERIQYGLTFLRTLARLQSQWNQLPTWLVLGPRRCIEFTPKGEEIVSDQIAGEGYAVSNYLAPWAPLERTAWWEQRSERIRTVTVQKNPVLIISLFKGGREATPEELELFAGSTPHGIPMGLARCSVCFEWKGQCLDPSPKFQGLLVSVACRCENENRCARCFQPLYERKLNANYYRESDGQIWHVSGSICERHRCGSQPIVSAGGERDDVGRSK